MTPVDRDMGARVVTRTGFLHTCKCTSLVAFFNSIPVISRSRALRGTCIGEVPGDRILSCLLGSLSTTIPGLPLGCSKASIKQTDRKTTLTLGYQVLLQGRG